MRAGERLRDRNALRSPRPSAAQALSKSAVRPRPTSGLKSAVNISSHSGRRGLASELVRRGASTTAIQAAGGWRSAEMVLRYAAAVDVEDGAVARHLG